MPASKGSLSGASRRGQSYVLDAGALEAPAARSSGSVMPHTYDWLDDIPFWERTSVGLESRVFSLEDFLVRSNRPTDGAWFAHFKRWCSARQSRCLERYDARSIGAVCGVEMVVIMRQRISTALN